MVLNRWVVTHFWVAKTYIIVLILLYTSRQIVFDSFLWYANHRLLGTTGLDHYFAFYQQWLKKLNIRYFFHVFFLFEINTSLSWKRLDRKNIGYFKIEKIKNVVPNWNSTLAFSLFHTDVNLFVFPFNFELYLHICWSDCLSLSLPPPLHFFQTAKRWIITKVIDWLLVIYSSGSQPPGLKDLCTGT